MNKADNNDKDNSNTKNNKKHILRAMDIILGSQKNNSETNNYSNQTNANQHTNEVPKFDLTEEILAEQRKTTSIKRKAPGTKSNAPNYEREVALIGFDKEKSRRDKYEQEQIIAEIVERDVEKLCSVNII